MLKREALHMTQPALQYCFEQRCSYLRSKEATFVLFPSKGLPVFSCIAMLAMAACVPDTGGGAGSAPLSSLPTGSVESTLRQQQLQNIRAGANPGVQNAPVTGINPGVGGIERAADGGGGSTAAGGVDTRNVNPGAAGLVRQGVGAPASSR